MANELYKSLITEFLAATGGEGETVTDSDVVEFVYEDFVVHVCPHPDETCLLVEVQICQCDLENVTDAFPRMLLLHKLNAAARFTHGAMAFIDEDEMLTVSQTLRLAETDSNKLAATIDALLETAAALQTAWQSMQSPEIETDEEAATEAPGGATEEPEAYKHIRDMP